MISLLRAAALGLTALMVTPPDFAHGAEAYPSQPIRIVAPYGPGGSSDFLARMIADNLSKAVGKPVIVENRPGASGMLGTELVVKAPADGYTLLMGFAAEIAIAPGLYPNIAYDPAKDLSPIVLAATYPMGLVVNPKLAANNMQELIALARSSGGALAYASSGSGSPAHIAFELLANRTGVTMTHIPYKGGGQALTDVLGGHTPMFFSSLAPIIPYIKANQLRAIAVSTANRSPVLPDVPGMAEAGVRDFDLDTWNGVFAPAGTPPAVIARLNTEISAIMQRPDIAKRLSDAGAQFVPMTPAEVTKFMNDELTKYKKIIKELGIKAE